MLTSIKVQGIRCFGEPALVELLPITVLVGQNGAGKSTLARLFPLFRQSQEARVRGPLLWNGRFVDFGDFETVRGPAGDERPMVLTFNFRFAAGGIAKQLLVESDVSPYLPDNTLLSSDSPVTCSCELELGQRADGTTFVQRATLQTEDFHANVHASADGNVTSIASGSTNYDELTTRSRWLLRSDGIIPTLMNLTLLDSKHGVGGMFVRQADPLLSPVAEWLERFVHGKTKRGRVREIAQAIALSQPGLSTHALRQIAPDLHGWQKFVDSLSEKPELLSQLRERVFLRFVPHLFVACQTELGRFVRGVAYMEPLRAVASRYYRAQELAVDEVDSRGENLAVFLRSLDRNDLNRLNEWLREMLGFSIEARRTGAHIEVGVIDGQSGRWTNLADTGFGYSQLAPLAVQLWTICFHRRTGLRDRGRELLLVIEQPELHLHPAMQARLADVFASAVVEAERRKMSLKLVLETHSAALIERIGALVEAKRLVRDCVQVIVFERGNDGATTLRHAQFDEEGVLTNWPSGFLEAPAANVV